MATWQAFPVVSRKRVALAFAVAVATDAAQVLMGPLGWTFADEILDILAMVLISWAVGFHPLLLPTFIIELVPIVDMIPTWTACTGMVVMFRRRASGPPPPERPVYDVESPPASAPAPRAELEAPPERN